MNPDLIQSSENVCAELKRPIHTHEDPEHQQHARGTMTNLPVSVQHQSNLELHRVQDMTHHHDNWHSLCTYVCVHTHCSGKQENWREVLEGCHFMTRPASVNGVEQVQQICG